MSAGIEFWISGSNRCPLDLKGITSSIKFDEGIVTMTHLETSPESSQVCVPLIQPGSAHSVRAALCIEGILWSFYYYGFDSKIDVQFEFSPQSWDIANTK